MSALTVPPQGKKRTINDPKSQITHPNLPGPIVMEDWENKETGGELLLPTPQEEEKA